MSIVAAHGVHKAYGPHVVLRSAELAIDPGQRVGMVGKNGAGKSTLGRILAGVEHGDGGTVARRRGASLLYLEQVPTFAGDPSAHDAAAEGLSGWHDARRRYEEVSRELAQGQGDVTALLAEQATIAEELERLGGWDQTHRVDAMLGHLGIGRPEARLSELSGGEQRRVALARILIARPDLAILDEPTNHLDAETVEWLEQYLLEEHQGALLLITHDRYLLDRVAERTLEVADGEVHAYDGGYGEYLEQKAERLAHAARTEQNRQNFLRREIEWLRRQPKARSTKQKARIERAEGAMAVQAPRGETAPSFALDVARTGKTILETRGLSLEQGGRALVKKLDLIIAQGERIGVVGPNGSGKTTLLRALLGAHPAAAGEVVIGQNTRVAYYDQLRSGLSDDRSIFDNVGGDQSRIQIGDEVIEVRSYLERFGFDGHQQLKKVGALSGGERARVALARMLRQSANLVIMDEPTNDLDVATLGALESMLVEYGITALIVTHDRWFLDRVATAILAFEDGGAVLRYPGNYGTFRRLRAEAREQAPSKAQPAPAAPKAAQPERAARKKQLSRAEERELGELPQAIDRAEAAVAALEARLADPGTYARGGAAIPELMAELDAAKARAVELTARWEELELKKLAP